jgi:type 2 lantibiotic biosynthesis protein LanM
MWGYGEMLVETKSATDLVRIVEKASSLAERLSGAFVPRDEITEDIVADVEAKLQRWCHNVSKGDWESFDRRLLWDDLDRDTVRRVLGPVRLAEGQPLPDWAHTLDEALCQARDLFSVDNLTLEDRCLDRAAPMAFEELWLAFVRVARQRLIAKVGADCQLLADEAHAALERELLRTLSVMASQALYLEFQVFQAMRQPEKLLDLIGDQDSAADQSVGEPSRAHYVDFVRSMATGGLSGFFGEYAVLGRLVAEATGNWVEATAAFLSRLASDLPHMQRLFGPDLHVVVSVTPGLSDPHNHGRSVIAMRFECGQQLVYKPRDIGLEETFNALSAWLNDQGVSPAFKVLKVLGRATHGWVEFVEHLPCQNKDDAAQFYHRAGMLIAVLHLLHGSDCHYGNLIACGPHPMLVDLEVLFNPIIAEDLPADDENAAQVLASQQFQNSVLTSGLLPIWHHGPDGSAYDISGLGSRTDGRTFMRPHWQYVNTDRMALTNQKEPIPQNSAVPYLDGVALSPNDYLAEIVRGFRQMYRFFLDNRTALLSDDGPLAAFKHLRARFVYRNTGLYAQLLKHATAPRYLGDGVERSIHFELASRALIMGDTKPRYWPILKEEARALHQMDIPLLSMYTDSDSVITAADDIIVANAFVESGYHLTIDTLNGLDEADMELQSGFISASMYTRLLGQTDHKPQAAQQVNDLPEVDGPLTQSQLVEEAVRIADGLIRSAIRSGKGMMWITLEFNAELERHELKPLSHSLYSGLPGIALFFAALAKVTGRPTYHDLALSALHAVRVDLAKGDLNRAARLGRQMRIGSCYGIGAIVYAFTRLSQLLDDVELLSEARQAAAMITPSQIADDQYLDLFSGSAGAILSLLALNDAKADKTLLEQAAACGQRLLDSRAASGFGYRAWRIADHPLLTGCSHGAAGIAYALLRLYERTSDPQLIDAASEAIAYERSIFSPEAGNWPDLRYSASETTTFTTSWCHGAPGIGLARLGGLHVLDSDEIRQDINVALETTRSAILTTDSLDHLCCGTLGRVETLFKAGQLLSRPELTGVALAVAARVIRAAQRKGSYVLFGGLPAGIETPGFFQGVSGIGYQLLRLAYPETLPSVLLLE